MSLRSSGSSVDKGESLKDTALTLAAYDPDVIVDPPSAHRRAAARRALDGAHVVNAGDGKHQHPTQALLDLYTMREALGRLEGVHVAIVGDVAALARRALARRGAAPRRRPRDARRAADADAARDRGRWAARSPTTSMRSPLPTSSTSCGCSSERMAEAFVPSLREYSARWGIDAGPRAAGTGRHASGPMNRGVEIDPRVADSPAALVTTQVRSGLVVRMAVLYDLLTSGPVAVARRRWRWRDARLPTCSEGHDHRSKGGSSTRRRQSTRRLRVTVEDGVITRLEPGTDGRLVIAPAFVDPHVHLRTPGREDEETIASGTAAAAAGGYCAILAMPNTDPVVDSASVLGGARRAGRTGGGRPDRLHAAAISEGTARRGADRDGRARRRRRRRVHGRRPPGRLGRPVAPRAPVLRRHRAAARPALRGADALARRPGARGSGLGRARLRRAIRRSRRASWSRATSRSPATRTGRCI